MEEKSDLLENLPGLEHDTLAMLNDARITKVGQLLQLQQEPDEFGLLSCGVPLIDLVEGCNAAVSKFGARRQLELRPTETISTNLTALNEAFDGGLLRGGITVLNGNSKCLNFTTRLFSRHKCTLIIVGGGSGARVSRFEGRKLIVPSVWKLIECLIALHDDMIALQAIGGVSSDVIIIDGISRLLTPALGIRSEARSKIRGTVCDISAALRSLATDANCLVVIIAPEDACTSYDSMWEHVVDARVEFTLQSYNREFEETETQVEERLALPGRGSDRCEARITRKNGVGETIDFDMASLL